MGGCTGHCHWLTWQTVSSDFLALLWSRSQSRVLRNWLVFLAGGGQGERGASAAGTPPMRITHQPSQVDAEAGAGLGLSSGPWSFECTRSRDFLERTVGHSFSHQSRAKGHSPPAFLVEIGRKGPCCHPWTDGSQSQQGWEELTNLTQSFFFGSCSVVTLLC